MSDLNIRNIDSELRHQAKLKATTERTTLRALVIDMLEKYVATPAGNVEMNAAHCPVNGPLISKGTRIKRGKK